MKLLFLGTGPSDIVPKNKNGRLNSSLYVDTNSCDFVIDCSDSFAKQVKRESIRSIDFILQTHAHSDAMGGLATQLKGWMRKQDIQKMPLYCEKKCWEKISERIKDHDHLDPHFINPEEEFKPCPGVKITPFRLMHSIQKGFPTVGYRFKDVVYAEDVGTIPENSEKYFKDAEVIIFDAAMWFDDQIKGHHNVNRALEKARKFHPQKFILTQAGHTYPPQKEAEEQIQDYWKEHKGRAETEVILAHDGFDVSVDTRRVCARRIISKFFF